LHGLSRKTADRFGMNGEYVARQLNKHLENQTVYSDRWEDDNKWLTMLFDQAGIRQKFQLTQLDDIITDDQKTIWEATRNIVIHESGLKRHRASSDARIVQTTWVRSLPAGRSQSF
ncbi:MAG: hypothetical protein OEZ15_10895, partial [Gammaproteobacteria bacterium]|nr:hypothetical protein [Gammaproteobacteria bacterium]